MSLGPRPVESVQRKRPSGVSAPPVGKFPSRVIFPTGCSLRPVGWICVVGPTMFDTPPAAQASPALARMAAVKTTIRKPRPRMAAIVSPRHHL